MPSGNENRSGGRFEGEDDEIPIERTNAFKTGGCFTMTLRAESARAIGLEPTEASGDDDIQFLVSEVDEKEGRLVFDLLKRPEDSR